MNSIVTERQMAACERAGVKPTFLSASDRIAIARDFDPERFPINGLRHPAHDNMCGWYIWSGDDLSDDPEHFEVICYGHLLDDSVPWLEYLALPSGWRFLAAPGYEDAWWDETLITA
jgi:hypothetical protein